MNVIQIEETTYYFGNKEALQMALSKVGTSPPSPSFDYNSLVLFADTVVQKQKNGEELVLKCRVGLSNLIRGYYYLQEKDRI